MMMELDGRLSLLGAVVLLALVLSAALLKLLQPWLARYALARPNARSSHREPTPQGGGIAVVAATLVVACGATALSPVLAQAGENLLLMLTGTTALLALVGAIDDLRPLPATVRLAMQCVAVAALIAMLPSDLQILPQVPWWVERAVLLLAGVWFVNLVNFMDGIDWMTVAEVVPVSGALLVLGLAGALPLFPALVAAALLGAMLGFAPFNKPVARVFLGDVGSLPIGLLLGWLLLELAAGGHLAAAIILPLYYLCDATITLMRRMLQGERFWQAHRSHFYQRATDNGFSVSAVVTHVVLVNVALAGLALVTVQMRSTWGSFFAVAAALAIVAWLLLTFARTKR
jgi:UDP-N-acetylmuramyl pentapeptide phosphotransferase/UDP-N-acetylglucosamine-1-phosphate transferase